MTFEELTPERVRAVLDERARALARPLEGRVEEPKVPCVIFGVGRERCAIEAAFVRTIAKLEHFARVPGAPSFIHGVTHVRGEVLALVDLGALFEISSEGLSNYTRAIVLGRERDEMAVPAREVELAELARSKLTASSQPARSKWVAGIAEDGTVLIDGAKLLDDDDLLPVQRASQEEA